MFPTAAESGAGESKSCIKEGRRDEGYVSTNCGTLHGRSRFMEVERSGDTERFLLVLAESAGGACPIRGLGPVRVTASDCIGGRTGGEICKTLATLGGL